MNRREFLKSGRLGVTRIVMWPPYTMTRTLVRDNSNPTSPLTSAAIHAAFDRLLEAGIYREEKQVFRRDVPPSFISDCMS